MDQSNVLRVEPTLSAKVLAAMSYFGILSLVALLLNRSDEYVRFHSRQGVVLWIWEVLAVYTLVIPGIGRLFFGMSSFICIVLSIIGVMSVIMGRAWKFPVVGNWAEKL
ncbi:MAG: hypothetical protein HQL54_05380 [Magnetococcales bacterium]|nr:hypothetical protein [Magnetococcales bacterium]